MKLLTAYLTSSLGVRSIRKRSNRLNHGSCSQRPRILHAGGDATGAHIEATLSTRVREFRIKVLEYCLVTEIVVDDGWSAALKPRIT